jgi:hypothetical protein
VELEFGDEWGLGNDVFGDPWVKKAPERSFLSNRWSKEASGIYGPFLLSRPTAMGASGRPDPSISVYILDEKQKMFVQGKRKNVTKKSYKWRYASKTFESFVGQEQFKYNLFHLVALKEGNIARKKYDHQCITEWMSRS